MKKAQRFCFCSFKIAILIISDIHVFLQTKRKRQKTNRNRAKVVTFKMHFKRERKKMQVTPKKLYVPNDTSFC